MDEAELHALLHDAGLSFQAGRDDRGRTLGRFTYATSGGESLAMTAIVRGEILQLVVHHVLAGSGEEPRLWRMNELNQDSYVARIYHRAERASFDLSGGIPVSAARRAGVLAAELGYLARSVAAFRLGTVHHPELPESPNQQSIDDVSRAAKRAGFAMEARRDGRLLVGTFTYADGGAFLVELFKAAGRFLCLRAHPPGELRVREDLAVLEHLQRVNAGLAIGAAAIARGEARVYYTLALVLDWVVVDVALVRYLIEGAGAAVRVTTAFATP